MQCAKAVDRTMVMMAMIIIVTVPVIIPQHLAAAGDCTAHSHISTPHCDYEPSVQACSAAPHCCAKEASGLVTLPELCSD